MCHTWLTVPPGLPSALANLCMPSNAGWFATADVVCRGVYPWDGPGAASVSPATIATTREQLITQLRTHSNEVLRATEELSLLEDERKRCLASLGQRQAAIRLAIEGTQQRLASLQQVNGNVPNCTSFASLQPASTVQRIQEQQYCTGLLLLLNHQQRKTAARLLAALAAFDVTDWDEAGVPADMYECDEEEDAM